MGWCFSRFLATRRGRGAGAGMRGDPPFSPATGIVDSHAYMLSLLEEAERAGAMCCVWERRHRGAARWCGRYRGCRERRGFGIAGARAGELRGAWGAGDRFRTLTAFRQGSWGEVTGLKGSYFSLIGPLAVFTACISARTRWARRAPDARYGRACAVRAGCSVDRATRL